jgi:hypothetical protein
VPSAAFSAMPELNGDAYADRSSSAP